VTFVSLVICTRNRGRQLSGCLDAVAAIRTRIPWELIIVDNGSSDDTARVCAEFATAAAFPVCTVHEAIPGLGRARNRGWHAAKGDLITFTDDDCYVAPDHIDRVVDLFVDPAVGYGGGRITLFDPTDYPLTIQLQDTPERVPPQSYVRAGFLQGANMAFRRAALAQIAGFDPSFGPGNRFVGDDVDAECRALFAGWVGAYDPTLTVAHHHGRKAAAARRMMHVYNVAIGAYWAKFLLRSDTRATFMRYVYWETRRAPIINVVQEAEGAIKYFLTRMFSWKRDGQSPLPSAPS
jgi:glycosyltransferase involved in cell wall biosynthesis